jgi:hypothetical protein
MRNVLWMPLLVCSLPMMGCSGSSSPAGTYIAHGPTFGIMLQIEKGADNRINGTISSAEVNSNGEVSAASKPVNGTVEGKAINFSIINPAGNDPATVPVSGTVTEKGLELTFLAKGRATSLTFDKGKAEDFSSLVQSVQRQSHQLSGT